MKTIIIYLIKFYQITISPDHSLLGGFLFGNCCIFRPTCSEYCILAISKFGCIKGLKMSFLRLIKCHPFHSPDFDQPV